MFQLEPPGPSGTTYNWFVNGEPQDDMGNPATVVMPTMGDMATITVQWLNSQGCFEMASTTVGLEEPDIEFPNAFTPNGDGENERFRPRVVGPANLDELLVFNRWGQVVYQGNDPDGWDGRFKGEPAPPEVYVYLATFRFPNGDEIEYKGDVTLIR
jgi:gliding motility-associated-like protein